MIEINKLKSLAVSYDTATKTVIAIFGEKPEFNTVKLSENGMKLIEDVVKAHEKRTKTSLCLVVTV